MLTSFTASRKRLSLEIPFHQIGGEIRENQERDQPACRSCLEIPFHQIGGEIRYNRK